MEAEGSLPCPESLQLGQSTKGNIFFERNKSVAFCFENLAQEDICAHKNEINWAHPTLCLSFRSVFMSQSLVTAGV
jgi:hypothetical protein